MKPLLIDLCCGEGGAAKGYADAGFQIIGVDYNPQPRYPFAFVQADLEDGDDLAWLLSLIQRAAAVHASPPCQFATDLNNDKSRHRNLIPAARALARASGKPYVIENVRRAAAHLINPVSLFGTMFDMHVVDSQGRRFDLSRERLFETNWPLPTPWDPGPQHPIANVFGGHLRVRSGEFRTGNGTGRTVDLPGEDRAALAAKLMGMPWATMQGMSEAAPPPFTHFIGEQLLEHLRRAA